MHCGRTLSRQDPVASQERRNAKKNITDFVVKNEYKPAEKNCFM